MPLDGVRSPIPAGGRPVTLPGGEAARLVNMAVDGTSYAVVTRDTLIWLYGVRARDAMDVARSLRPL